MSDTPWPHFFEMELQCRCGCGRGSDRMDPDFMERLVALRERLGFPLKITSGFRCPDHNVAVAHTGPGGPHTTGRAVDILACGDEARRILAAHDDFGFTGIGADQVGPHSSRFIHLDDLGPDEWHPRPWFWTYA